MITALDTATDTQQDQEQKVSKLQEKQHELSTSYEQWLQWRQHSYTQEFVKTLNLRRDNLDLKLTNLATSIAPDTETSLRVVAIQRQAIIDILKEIDKSPLDVDSH